MDSHKKSVSQICSYLKTHLQPAACVEVPHPFWKVQLPVAAHLQFTTSPLRPQRMFVPLFFYLLLSSACARTSQPIYGGARPHWASVSENIVPAEARTSLGDAFASGAHTGRRPRLLERHGAQPSESLDTVFDFAELRAILDARPAPVYGRDFKFVRANPSATASKGARADADEFTHATVRISESAAFSVQSAHALESGARIDMAAIFMFLCFV